MQFQRGVMVFSSCQPLSRICLLKLGTTSQSLRQHTLSLFKCLTPKMNPQLDWAFPFMSGVAAQANQPRLRQLTLTEMSRFHSPLENTYLSCSRIPLF